MTSQVTLIRKIHIPIIEVNKQLMSNLFRRLKQALIDTCTKDGYIIDVKKINSIKDNYITSTQPIFLVSFNVEILKPEIGKIFTDEICMIFPYGILVNIKKCMKVFISHETLLTPTKKLNKGDIITVKITDVKYSKQKFICIGEICMV